MLATWLAGWAELPAWLPGWLPGWLAGCLGWDGWPYLPGWNLDPDFTFGGRGY